MSEALSAEDLKAIRERANHAGGGPWEIFQHGDGSWLIRHYAGGMVAAAGFSNANADFIAHSRTDIPVLLAEIARLSGDKDREALIAALCGRIEEWCGVPCTCSDCRPLAEAADALASDAKLLAELKTRCFEREQMMAGEPNPAFAAQLTTAEIRAICGWNATKDLHTKTTKGDT